MDKLSPRILEMIKGLSPAYFAMVMATGIVSIASQLLGMTGIARAMFMLNIFAYAVLLACTILRFILYRPEFFKDLFSHTNGVGFFTLVTATCVLGSQSVLLNGDYGMALILWVVGIVLWLIVTYTVFITFTIKEDKPPLEVGINGAWLLAVVSTQALAVLSAQLSMHFEAHKLIINFFAFSMCLWCGMQYIWMISLIFYR